MILSPSSISILHLHLTRQQLLQSTSHHLQDRERTFQDEVSFFNVTMPLMTAQNGQIAPGQYQVPFSFTLPHSLPGVFAEEEGFNGSDNYR